RHCDASALTAVSAPDWSEACCAGEHLDDVRHVPSRPPPSSRVPAASDARGARKACFQTGAHAQGVCHHGCRRIPRDHARKRAPGTIVFTAFDSPIPLSLQYGKGGGATSDFPVSAITGRLYARDQFNHRPASPVSIGEAGHAAPPYTPAVHARPQDRTPAPWAHQPTGKSVGHSEGGV